MKEGITHIFIERTFKIQKIARLDVDSLLAISWDQHALSNRKNKIIIYLEEEA